MSADLMEACFDGDAVHVRRVLDDAAAPSVGPDGNNIVHVAAMRDDVAFLDAVLECVEQRCGVETKRALLAGVTDEHRCTPLHHAACESDVATTRRLVRHGADVDARDRYGRTPFLVAAHKGHADVVRFYVEHAAAKSRDALERLVRDRCERDECTALHRACYVRDHVMARTLLEAGADPSCHNAWGATPLSMAVASNDDRLVHAFLDHVALMDEAGRAEALNTPTRDGVLPLHVARVVGNSALVLRLVEHGALDRPSDVAHAPARDPQST